MIRQLSKKKGSFIGNSSRFIEFLFFNGLNTMNGLTAQMHIAIIYFPKCYRRYK